MRYIFIFSLFLTSQTNSYPNYVAKLKQDIKKIQESIAAPFDKKIEKEIQKLNALCIKIEEKQSFKNIKIRIEELKTNVLYKQKLILEQSLKIIASLLDYTNSTEAPKLLASVCQLLEAPELTHELKPFLHKQRARLIDSLDEGLFSASLAKQIHILQKNLVQEFEFCITTLTTEPLYKELANLHALYLTEKEPKQALASIEKITALEHDKIAAFYKNKEVKTLTSKLNCCLSEAPETNQLLLFADSNKLPNIANTQRTLLLQSLDIYIL